MKKLFVLLVFVLLSGSAFATVDHGPTSSNEVTKSWWPGDWDNDYRYGRDEWFCEARDSEHGRRRDGDWGPAGRDGDWGPADGDWGFFRVVRRYDDYYSARSRYRQDARDRALEKCHRDFDTCIVRCTRDN